MNQTLLHVCAFESRRREEMARLIERFGGIPTVAPSMREVPLTDNTEVFAFSEQILKGEIDIVVFMTGVGTNALFDLLETQQLAKPVQQKLADCMVVARGPKPSSALSQRKIRVDIKVPDPNTWREIAAELQSAAAPLVGKRIAIQEYGAPSEEFYEWLHTEGAQVTAVPIYRWALPEDVTELENAVQACIRDEFDVLLWTSAQQVNHATEIAARLGVQAEWLAAANRCVIGSIGPTASERLREFGLMPDLEPSQLKMAHLVREALAWAREHPRG